MDIIGTTGAPHAFRAKEVSVHGGDAAADALRIEAGGAVVEMAHVERRMFTASSALSE